MDQNFLHQNTIHFRKMLKLLIHHLYKILHSHLHHVLKESNLMLLMQDITLYKIYL